MSHAAGCPLEPIPDLLPPQNLTSHSWEQLKSYSDAARALKMGAFLCMPCLAKHPEAQASASSPPWFGYNHASPPWFYFEDGYRFVEVRKGSERHYIGWCRGCAPEMHAAVLRKRITNTALVLVVLPTVAAIGSCYLLGFFF
jgi:hypothetical protein